MTDFVLRQFIFPDDYAATYALWQSAGEGIGIGGFDGRRGMVYHLAVASEYRRQGLARQLMEELECRLRQKGCRKAYLLVKKGNEGAKSFYKKYGWDEMDHVELYGKSLA